MRKVGAMITDLAKEKSLRNQAAQVYLLLAVAAFRGKILPCELLALANEFWNSYERIICHLL
jgi:hypothetical protein